MHIFQRWQPLPGQAIGAMASVGTTWLAQRHQDRSQHLAQNSNRLEQVFGEFIDQASRLFADALTHQLDDLSKLVPLYAIIGKLRLYASNTTVLCADRVMSRILDAYYSPNVNFETERIRDAENYDVLRAFIAACQTELKSHALRKMTSEASSSSNGDGQRELVLADFVSFAQAVLCRGAGIEKSHGPNSWR